MGRYISKPKSVDAIQWTGENLDEINDFLGNGLRNDCIASPLDGGVIQLHTPYLGVEIFTSDWIIRNGNGVVFMANDESFKDRYALAEETLSVDGGSNENPLGD